MITYSGVVSVVAIALAAVTVVYLLIALLDPERF
ncbi:K+-transporting ATPase subunit F [Rhodococcoides kyotonense]|uniref:K+-transporting ATPase subunit F n=1 Tax=Rhodococcoides kyotonense TaxID=398843 RepID=A0A177Y7R4_9NOCA|nr:K+-transporting ATPase subunit F [Rhodococcus kyotonensis]